MARTRRRWVVVVGSCLAVGAVVVVGPGGDDEQVGLEVCEEAFPLNDEELLDAVRIEPASVSTTASGPLGVGTHTVEVEGQDPYDTPGVSGSDVGVAIGARTFTIVLEPDASAVRWVRREGQGIAAGGVVMLRSRLSPSGDGTVAVVDIADGAVLACDRAAFPLIAASGDRPVVINSGRGGSELWVSPVARDGDSWSVDVDFTATTATVDDDVVVAAAHDGQLAVIERDGDVRWELPATTVDERVDGGRSHLRVHDDVLLVAERVFSASGDLVAYDLDDGAERWRAPGVVGGDSTLPDKSMPFTVVDGVVLVHDADDPEAVLVSGALRGLDVESGEQRWERPTVAPGGPDLGELLAETPGAVPVDGGVLLVSEIDSSIGLFVLDPATGEVVEVPDGLRIGTAARGGDFVWIGPPSLGERPTVAVYDSSSGSGG